MFTKTEISAGELKSYRTETNTTEKTWLYVTCDVECMGQKKTITQSLLYTTAKKGKRDDTAANRIRQFLVEPLLHRVRYHRAHTSGWGLISAGEYFADYYNNTNNDLKVLSGDILTGEERNGWRTRVEALAERIAANVNRMEIELRKAIEHWDAHGFLDWDYEALPMWNMRSNLDEFFHKISVDKLHRLHIVFARSNTEREHCSALIAGRNLSARKKIEAQLHLLNNSVPATVSLAGPRWNFYGKEGVELAHLWKKNFYDDIGFRSMMMVPIKPVT